MTGKNGERMAVGEGYDNLSFVRGLMKRFAKMGFKIVNQTNIKI